MVTALQPISGFLNLAPVAPVLPRGRGSEQLVPFVGLAITDASTLVNIGTTPTLPLTYTANGSFTATLKFVPAAASVDGARRVSLGITLDLELTVRETAAGANAALADVRADVLRTLVDAMTTETLLTSLGGTSSSLSGTLGLLGEFLADDLGRASITAPSSAGTTATAGIFNDVVAGDALAALPAVSIGPAADLLTIEVAPPDASAGPTTIGSFTGVATFGTFGGATTGGTLDAATDATGTATAVPGSAVLTAAPAPAPTAAAAAAATDAALLRFLTDAAARAHDTVTHNPNYASAAAALYATTAVYRSPAAGVTPSGLGPDAPVRMTMPAAAVEPLPTSVT